jgi:hypothetical protein
MWTMGEAGVPAVEKSNLSPWKWPSNGQAFLRFSGDVSILRRESSGLIGRRQQCKALILPLPLVCSAKPGS